MSGYYVAAACAIANVYGNFFIALLSSLTDRKRCNTQNYVWPKFCENMMKHIMEDKKFLSKFFFSEKLTFVPCGKVNRHHIHFWGSENLHAMVEQVKDSLMINIFCDLSYTKKVTELSSMTCLSCV